MQELERTISQTPKVRYYNRVSAQCSTDKIQGVRFGKDDFTFNGSKIDRTCSYSKIDYQLQQNNRAQETSIHPFHPEHSQNQPSTLEAAGSLLGGLFDFPTSDSDFDPEQAEWLRQHRHRLIQQSSSTSIGISLRLVRVRFFFQWL